MGLWEQHVVPRIVDLACSLPEINGHRSEICQRLGGRVLEVGFGSGANIDYYPAGVESVSAVEPSDVAWQMSAAKRAAANLQIDRTGLDGQELQADDNWFDSAIVTFSLCTIPDASAALREVARVVKPRGALAFIEHGLSPDDGVAKWQHRLDPIERALAGGCNLSRDIPGLIEAAGFKIDDLEAGYLKVPALARPWSYVYSGSAVIP